MKKEVIILSLGGSIIIPEDINLSYLKKFKRIIKKFTKKYKFVIVCGGGSLARKYIKAIKSEGIGITLQSFAGISATRTNARFMSYFFEQDSIKGIPHTTETLEENLKEKDIVFCGALEYRPDQTSDSTAAILAKHFNSEFINITNIKGLYTDNPLTNKNAKFISKINWNDFLKRAEKIKFTPGQHFVLDQKAAKIIQQEKIKTYIIGPSPKQLENLLNKKKFIGTTIVT